MQFILVMKSLFTLKSLKMMLHALANLIQGHQCLVSFTLYITAILFHLYISGVSGHMFTNVSRGQHDVTVNCTSTDDPNVTASSTAYNLQFLYVYLEVKSRGTEIIVSVYRNIEATHKCKLDDSPFVDCKPWAM